MAAAAAGATPPAPPPAQVEGTATPRDGFPPTMPAGHGVEGAEGGPNWATYVSQVVASQLQAHTANITAQVQNAVATTMQHAQGTIISQLQAHFAPTMQRVDGHDLAIGDIQRKQFSMEDAQKEM
eukprot:3719089-Pyramimonas_sp.AAC.1